MSKEIPIFFSTDDNYMPYLDVAIASLIDNASKNYNYRIIVLNTGLRPENILKVKRRERSCFKIDFIDISECIKDIKSHFKNIYHFSVATYYRLFISSLFPQYDKIVYLDCDLVVLGDISKLYNTPLGENILAAAPDQYVKNTKEFRAYAENAIGVNPDGYFNAGVLVINLKEFRKNHIENKFIDLITKYDFDLLDPDQAYLNFLCQNKIYMLPTNWNAPPISIENKRENNIVHYNLYKKPWQYDNVKGGEFFWHYAKKSPFYEEILKSKADFGDEEKAKKEAAAEEILRHANLIIASDCTFSKLIRRS